MSASPTDVVDYYEAKTASILAKYGPGPRIHFHIGLVDDAPPADLAAEELRARLTAGQEALLQHTARRWDADRTLSGRVLDVGCGFGGGSIYWAQEHGAQVTALTIVPGHEQLIRELAGRAGVRDHVGPVIADACAFDDPQPFDAAVAFESACYLPREFWFRRLAKLVHPGGHVFVEDTFLEDPAAAAPFDAYWRTRVGTADEYRQAARDAGFRLESGEDVTAQTTGFWHLSQAYARRALESGAAGDERRRLGRSLEAHALFLGMWEARAITVRLLAFRRA